MQDSLSTKFIKNSFWLYTLSYLTAPLGYITRMIISNDLTVGEVGILYSLLGLMGMISAYSGGGLVEALKYFIPKFLINKELGKIKSIIILSFLSQVSISLLLIIIIFFCKDYIAINYFHHPEIADLLSRYGGYLLGANILQILSSVFLSFQDGFSGKIMDCLIAIITLIFTGFFAFIGEGSINSYGFVPLLALGISVIFGLIIYLKKYHKLLSSEALTLKKDFLKEIGSYSTWTFLTLNTNLLLGRIDQQIVLILSGATFAGLYTNYISLQNLASIVITPIAIILTPTITTLIIQKKEAALKTFLTTIYTYIGSLTISLSIFLLLFGPQIAQILFGKQYIESGLLLRYAAPFYIFTIFSSFNFTLLASIGKIKERTLNLIGVVPIYLILNIILIKNFNIYGAMATTIICKILIFYLTYKQAAPYKPRINRIPFIKISTIALLLGSLIYILETQLHILEIKNRREALIYLILYGIGYFGLLCAINLKLIKQIYKKWKEK